MTIDLPGFDFEKHRLYSGSMELLFDNVRQFLDVKGVNRQEYGLGNQTTAGLGELVIRQINGFWIVFTTERGVNYDVAAFSKEFHAVNYFIFRLTGEADTIDWANI